MKDAIKIIKNLPFEEDEYVVLACSYGPDSMCLLDLLSKNGFNVVVAHVNHKLRKESDNEYLELEEYCKNNGYIFEGMEIKEYPKDNIEAYARSVRYSFFKDLIKKYNAKYLFTAHHGDDLVETVLMRLVRGASFRGYAGFKTITEVNGYTLVRPLVSLTKTDIMDYVLSNNIPYAIDSTNLELVHTRNVYRHKILPVLKDINPNVHNKFLKFSNLINEYDEYISNEVENLYSNLYKNNRLDLNEFLVLPNLLKKCLINRILFEMYNDNINRITDEHLSLIMNVIDSDKVNASINLPCNVVVRKFYNLVEFSFLSDINDYDYVLEDEVIFNNGKLFFVKEDNIIKSNYLIRLDSKEISLPLHVRNRRTGDRISLKNSGVKKLSSIFIDEKIPLHLRDTYPVVCDNDGNILWIPGVKKSKFDKQYNEEYDIMIKYIKKGEENEE